MKRGFDGNKLYDSIDLLENGPGRAEALFDAITQADKAGTTTGGCFSVLNIFQNSIFMGKQ